MTAIDTSQMRRVADAGLQLIPLRHWSETSKDAKGRQRQDGKRPLDGNWTKKPYQNDEVLARAEREGRNVGVRLTAETLVIDVDPRNMPEGRNTFKELCAAAGINPDHYPLVKTGSGGLHLYMRKPADVPVVDSLEEFAGVEFKTVGRQVVAPGSVHPNGNQYVLDDPFDDLASPLDAPSTLLDRIRRPARQQGGGAEGGEYDQTQVAAMLEGLDPEDFQDHDTWRSLMMACHHASSGEARQEFMDWSTRDPKYADDGWMIGQRWDSLHRKTGDGVITFRTLHKFLRDAGKDDLIPRTSAADDFEDAPEPDTETATPKPKPAIRVRDGALVETVDAAKRALFQAFGGEVLQRHGQLVRPVRLGSRVDEGSVRHHEGATILMPVNENWLVHRMAASADWFRLAQQKDKADGSSGSLKRTPADPPQKVARVILNDQGAWPFHHVRGLVASPTVDLKTGQVIDRPGIDPVTGLLAVFEPSEFPAIRRDVGRDGAKERLDRVRHALFRDMPFVDGPSLSVAMSALLTALVRPTMRAAPMHLFDAAMPGTGKSKMASVVGVLATGVEPSASAWATSEDENEKRLAALLRKAAPVVLFDNVDAKRGDRIGGNMLNIVLTQDPASIRVLGKTEEETLNTRVTMLATGNNIAVAGDCCRRAVKCRLDARCAEPERRAFDWDPVEVARRDRGRLVADLLEALSAYIVAGKPTDPTPLGSFEDWTPIRGLLMWCGLADPADTMADVKATDAARSDLEAGLRAWHMAFDEEWVTAAELADFLAETPDMENILERELFEAQESMQTAVLAGRRDKGWIGKALLENPGIAAGAFYLEAEKGKRAARFRVTKHE